MTPQVAVGGVVLSDDSRVLMVQRAHAPMSGRWTLPGGRVELGERLRDAVKREVWEETAVQVSVQDLVDVVEIFAEGYHYVVLDYCCAPTDGHTTPVAGDDAMAARYFDPSELVSLGATPEVIRVVAKALAIRAGST